MLGDKRPKKCPVGTIRNWTSGEVIKTHDNSVFDNVHSPWMTVPALPDSIIGALKDLDNIAREIDRFKEPVEGGLWLDKELQDFVSTAGNKYSPGVIKQYEGWFGNEKYSFRNEVTKRFSSDKINLKEQQLDALLSENESKGGDYTNIVLTSDEIKEIKARVKARSRYINSEYNEADIYELRGMLTKIRDLLSKGENFEGEEKEVYQKNKSIRETFLNNYESLSIKKSVMKDSINEIDTVFKDNWGIKTSFKKKFLEQFNNYINKYSDRIKIEELENFKKQLGCEITAPIEEFYDSIDKLGLDQVDVHSYIGKQVPDTRNKYNDVTLVGITNEETDYPEVSYKDEITGREFKDYGENSLKRLAKNISSREVGDIQIPLQIRFNELYSKNLVGNWNVSDTPGLKGLEEVFLYLPSGHCLTNRTLNNFEKEDAFNSSSGFAHYNFSEKNIYFSQNACDYAQEMTSLDDGKVFASVIIHEIGHSVTQKYGRKNNIEYRKFAKECGWAWNQANMQGSEYRATDGDKDTERMGTNSSVHLITEYAHKSPEEAFAEYYSFYTQHKKHIDRFLETKDLAHVQRTSFEGTKPAEKVLSQFKKPSHEFTSMKKSEMTNHLLDNYRDLDRICFTDYATQHNSKGVGHEITRVGKDMVNRALKEGREEGARPVFTIRNRNGKHTIPELKHSAIIRADHFLQNGTPTYSISSEGFELLAQKGYSLQEIEDFTSDHLAHIKIKQPDKVVGPEKTHGLLYAGQLVPSHIIKDNVGILTQMKKIWHSEELAKAFDELADDFSTKEEVDIIKSEEVENKKVYTDCIVFNTKGQFLILKRSDIDDFEPSKYCLPGGKLEPGESPIFSAFRELLEETNLECENLADLHVSEEPDYTIHYFFGNVKEEEQILMLDNKEHISYEWIDIDEIDNFDFLLDLKDKLKEFLVTESIEDIEKSYQDIQLAFDNGVINEEKFLEYTLKYNSIIKAVKHTEEQLREHATNTPLEHLENTISTHKEPLMRKIAHEEMHRRTQEEHVQEEEEPKETKKTTEKKEDSPKKEKEISRLEKFKYYIQNKDNKSDTLMQKYKKELEVKKSEEDTSLEEVIIIEEELKKGGYLLEVNSDSKRVNIIDRSSQKILNNPQLLQEDLLYLVDRYITTLSDINKSEYSLIGDSTTLNKCEEVDELEKYINYKQFTEDEKLKIYKSNLHESLQNKIVTLKVIDFNNNTVSLKKMTAKEASFSLKRQYNLLTKLSNSI